MKCTTNRKCITSFIEVIKEYEYKNGRLNIREKKAFGLIDFTSEEADVTTPFIVVTPFLEVLSKQLELNDYRGTKRIGIYIS